MMKKGKVSVSKASSYWKAHIRIEKTKMFSTRQDSCCGHRISRMTSKLISPTLDFAVVALTYELYIDAIIFCFVDYAIFAYVHP